MYIKDIYNNIMSYEALPIDRAITDFYYPLNASTYEDMIKEFGTFVHGQYQEIIRRDEQNNNAANIPVNANVNAFIRVYLMVRVGQNNNFVNISTKKITLRTRERTIGINLEEGNTVFNNIFTEGTNMMLLGIGNDGRLNNVTPQYIANIYEPPRPFYLFIVLTPNNTFDDMLTYHIDNVNNMRRQGLNINIPSLEIIANIKRISSSVPINNVGEDIPRIDMQDRNNENIGPYREYTHEEELQDMGLNQINRDETTLNAENPPSEEQELEIELSTLPNIVSVNIVVNEVIDQLALQLVSKPINDYFGDYYNYDSIPDNIPSIIPNLYNNVSPYLGAILPRILPRANRRNFWAFVSIVGTLSLVPYALLWWNESMNKRKQKADQAFVQAVINEKVPIVSSQELIDLYIKYIDVTDDLTIDDKNLLSPLLKNTVVYHIQNGPSYISFPETMASLDENKVPIKPYFPEKYASNIPTPTTKSSPNTVSPSISMKPSATPRFTPSKEYNMGDKYEPNAVEQVLDVITGETSILPNISWVGSVLPILGSLMSNGLGILTSAVSAGISILSYIIIAGIAVGAYLFTTKK